MLRGICQRVITAAQAAFAQAALKQGLLTFTATGINFNSANTDTTIPITLPTGFTRYRVAGVRINGASASLTTATFGLFTAAAAGGTAIVTSATACTVSTASESTNNNMQSPSVNNTGTMSFTNANLFFRVQTPQGSAATGNVAIQIEPLS